ncbi:MAG: DMT family transporter [Chloroflexi bacterium]|nr:DMT family transporter [Chloroflexota bacterium]
MLDGALASLASALLWATTNLLVKLEAHRVGVVAMNAYRTTVGAVVMLAVFLAVPDPGRLLTMPLSSIAALLVSVIVGLVFGDTLNFRAMMLIGLARSFPISGSFPLFTLILAAVVLRESVGWREVIGCLVTLAGVMLVAIPSAGIHEPRLDRRTNLAGVACALGAAIMWSISSTTVKIGLDDLDVVAANAIRLPVAAAVLLAMTARGRPQPRPWQLPRSTITVIVLTGVLGSGLSGFLWMYGVQAIGAARAAVLSATSPIFAAPMSAALLKERLTRRILAGTLLSVAGIIVIVSAGIG